MKNLAFPLVRELKMISGGIETSLIVSVGGIEQLAERKFVCHFSLPRIGFEEDRVTGCDPLHALELCLRTISRLIRATNEDGLAEIWWHTKGDNGGFLFS